MISIKYIGITVVPDNELTLFEELFSVIRHADNYCEIIVNRKENEVIVHVKPSDPGNKQKLVDNLRFINSQKRQYRIRFSSSLKISKTISFIISTESIANLKSVN